ncbi:MAG: hypothetical protein MJ075_03310 [Oscillospiraceae bacterium]|nr:hypothetical protein [Oscillospiraceae bacterium]
MLKRCAAGLMAFLLCLSLCACASSDYEYACKLERAGNYTAAAKAFEKLGRYKDSVDHATDCRRQEAEAAKATGAAGEDAAVASIQTLEEDWINPNSDLLGDWFFHQDGTQDFLSGMENAMEAYPGLWDLCHYDSYQLTYRLSLYEDGSFTYCLDRDAILEVADAIIAATEEGMSQYLVNLVTETYASQNIPLEQVYADLEVDGMDGLLKWLRYDPAKMTSRIIQRSRFEASANKAIFTGSYQLTDSTLILTCDKGTDIRSYSLNQESLTLQAQDSASTTDLITLAAEYPLVFSRS